LAKDAGEGKVVNGEWANGEWNVAREGSRRIALGTNALSYPG
jgi:hypothetical protein